MPTPIDSLSIDQALSAIQNLGVDEWMVMNDYRNANPQTRGNYDEFRNQYFQRLKAQQQAQGLPVTAGLGLKEVRGERDEFLGMQLPGGGSYNPPANTMEQSVQDLMAERGVSREDAWRMLQSGVVPQKKPQTVSGTGGGEWPSLTGQLPSLGLRDVAAGRVPGQANLLPSLGAPSFMSPQSMSRLTPSELDIYGSEVERRGFPLADWQAQLQQQWGGFAQPGQFGGGRAKAITAPSWIR